LIIGFRVIFSSNEKQAPLPTFHPAISRHYRLIRIQKGTAAWHPDSA
jgi:hypothetical protein